MASPKSSDWTFEQNKLFENALADYYEDTLDWWQKLASAVRKTVEAVKRHYDDLVEDVNQIESGHIPLPNYKEMPSDKALNGADEEDIMASSESSNWTFEQNKLFENALANYYEETPHWWCKLASVVGKTVEEVKKHYDDLVEDANRIEFGHIPLPNYKEKPSDK